MREEQEKEGDQPDPQLRINDSKHGALRYMLLNNTMLTENSVSDSGPLLFLTDANNIQLCCGNTSTCAKGGTFDTSKCELGDLQSKSNDVIGTFVDNVLISPSEAIIVHASGTGLSALTVTLLNKMNKTTPIQASLVIRSLNGTVDLSGPPTIGVNFTGTVNVVDLKLTAVPGKYRLGIKITSEEGGTQSFNKSINVLVRECMVGEISIANKTLCRACPVNFYSFNASKPSCDACPKKKAECDGTTIAPLDGYWQSGSHSDVLLHCLNDNGCKYSNRTAALRQAAYINLGVETTWNGSYPLCNEVSLLMAILYSLWMQFFTAGTLPLSLHIHLSLLSTHYNSSDIVCVVLGLHRSTMWQLLKRLWQGLCTGLCVLYWKNTGDLVYSVQFVGAGRNDSIACERSQ